METKLYMNCLMGDQQGGTYTLRFNLIEIRDEFQYQRKWVDEFQTFACQKLKCSGNKYFMFLYLFFFVSVDLQILAANFDILIYFLSDELLMFLFRRSRPQLYVDLVSYGHDQTNKAEEQYLKNLTQMLIFSLIF